MVARSIDDRGSNSGSKNRSPASPDWSGGNTDSVAFDCRHALAA